jgi:protein ImuA
MLEELLRSVPRLWRGSRMPAGTHRTLPTGFGELDGRLPGGGWPVGAVVELLIGTPGIGEMRLLLPVIRHLALTGSEIVFVHPPYLLNAAALHGAGIPLHRLLVVRPEAARDAFWSAEQALRNPVCGAVLFWSRTEDRAPDDRGVRRLQVAAQDGQSILFLYRDGGRRTSQWAALRMELLHAGENELHVSVLKAAGTHERPSVRLNFERVCP